MADVQGLEGIQVIDDVPVIDVSGLIGDNKEEKTNAVKRIEAALRHLAFFQIINHGVSKELIDRTISVMDHFFSLPQETKNAIYRTPTNSKGYSQLLIFESSPLY